MTGDGRGPATAAALSGDDLRALQSLYDAGARYILLTAEKRPAPGSRPYECARPTPAMARAHIERGLHLGIEPGSLSYAVADVDGPRKGEDPVPEEAVRAVGDRLVAEHLGPPAACLRVPSLSGGGKCHIWRRIDSSAPAPLGRKADGRPYRSAPTDMYLDPAGPGSGSAYDIRYQRSYVRVTNYLAGLAAHVAGDRAAPAADAWALLIEVGHRYKPERPPVPLATEPVDPASIPDGEALARMNQGYIDRLPALTEGNRHNTLNSAGYRAGQESAWNPGLIDQLRAWARGQRVPGPKLRQLDKAYREGQGSPTAPPERRRATPAGAGDRGTPPGPPPIESYDESESPDRTRQPTRVGKTKTKTKTAAAAASDTSAATALRELHLSAAFVRETEGGLLLDIQSGRWYSYQPGPAPDAGWDQSLPGAVRMRVRGYLWEQCPDPAEPKLAKLHASEAAGSRLCKLVAEQVEIRASERFDLDPLLVGHPGGLVTDIRTLETRAAKIDDMVSVRTGVAPAALRPVLAGAQAVDPHPRFSRFLRETFPGDPGTVAYLLRYLGYCLTGLTDEHRALFLQGASRTGKSTLLKILRALFGLYARSVSPATFIRSSSEEHPTIKANLDGPRLVWFAESGEHKRLDDEMLSQVIGGDQMSARYMGRDYYDFTPRCKLLLTSNFRPATSGPESGVYERLRVILFGRVVPPALRDQGLPDAIVAEEGPAILRTLLREAHEWHRDWEASGRNTGLRPESRAIRAETARYFAESDPIGEFIELHIELEAGYRAGRGEVYQRYKSWAEDEGHAHLMTQTSLTRKLMNRLTPRGVTVARDGSGRYYDGMYLRSAADGPAARDADGDPGPEEAPF